MTRRDEQVADDPAAESKSLDRCNFRSTLRTIESARTGSIGLFDHGGGESSYDDMPSSRNSILGENASSSASSSLTVGNSSNSTSNSQTVSFSRLNEQEVNHLRTWKRRLKRTEVFDKYYFPQKWETKEMESLISFFGLEDPALRCGGSSGRRRGSGNSKNRSSSTDRRSRLRGSKGSSGGEGKGSSSSLDVLSSSLTSSLKDSAGKLTKLIVSRPELLRERCLIRPCSVYSMHL